MAYIVMASTGTAGAYMVMACIAVTCIGMACLGMASIGMASAVLAYIGMAYTVTACIVMASIVVASIVMANIVMTYTVMTFRWLRRGSTPSSNRAYCAGCVVYTDRRASTTAVPPLRAASDTATFLQAVGSTSTSSWLCHLMTDTLL